MRLVVARVGRAHGVRGEVTVEVRTDSPQERFRPGAELFVVPPGGGRAAPRRGAPVAQPASGSRPGPAGRGGVAVPVLPHTVTLASAREHSGTFLLSFVGIEDRDSVEALRGVLLEAELPDGSDEPDAWYDHQLTGLRVRDPAGCDLGEVVAVEHGAQDLLVVRTLDEVRRLVPFVTALVPVVDVPQGFLVVDAPPGLLEDVGEAASSGTAVGQAAPTDEDPGGDA